MKYIRNGVPPASVLYKTSSIFGKKSAHVFTDTAIVIVDNPLRIDKSIVPMGIGILSTQRQFTASYRSGKNQSGGIQGIGYIVEGRDHPVFFRLVGQTGNLIYAVLFMEFNTTTLLSKILLQYFLNDFLHFLFAFDGSWMGMKNIVFFYGSLHGYFCTGLCCLEK